MMLDESASAELAELLEDAPAREAAEEHQRRIRDLLALPPGIHEGVPEDVYHARVPGIASKSACDLVLRSPARYKAWIEGCDDRPPTRALHLGSATHMCKLEPARFERTYLVEPEWGDLRAVAGRTTKEQGKANKERRADWRRENKGATILEAKDAIASLGMVRALAAHADAGPLLSGGIPEVTLVWRCPVTGLICKARVDYWLPELRIAVDLKSTTDARERAFSRTIEDLGYHRQAGHYADGFAALGQPIDQFVFIAVEKEAPHDLSVWELDQEDVVAGAWEVLEAKKLLAECIANDNWPGYAPGVRRITRPDWARKNRAA